MKQIQFHLPIKLVILTENNHLPTHISVIVNYKLRKQILWAANASQRHGCMEIKFDMWDTPGRPRLWKEVPLFLPSTSAGIVDLATWDMYTGRLWHHAMHVTAYEVIWAGEERYSSVTRGYAYRYSMVWHSHSVLVREIMKLKLEKEV